VQQQRLLKNMGAHTVVLDLLQIPFETVSNKQNSPVLISLCFIEFFAKRGFGVSLSYIRSNFSYLLCLSTE